MQLIVVSDANDQLIETSLDGTTFFIRMTWNESAKQYGLSIENAEGMARDLQRAEPRVEAAR